VTLRVDGGVTPVVVLVVVVVAYVNVCRGASRCQGMRGQEGVLTMLKRHSEGVGGGFERN